MARRKGRGKLSSIELLPDHADDAVRWALEALSERKYPQTLILERFNEMLADLDPPCGSISASAFSRFSVRFAQQARKVTEAREAAAALAERLDDMPEGDIGLLLGETIKALINDVLLDNMVEGKPVSIKLLRDAAEAIQRLEAARKSSHEIGAKARRHAVQKAADAVESAASAKGLSRETVETIKAEILGVAQ